MNILRRKMQRIASLIIGHKVIVSGFYERIAYPEERGKSDISWGLSIFYIDTRSSF